MRPPTLQRAAGVFQLTFMDEFIDVRVDRVLENSSFQTSCELNIYSRRPTQTGLILGKKRINLSSAQTVNSTAKLLTARMPDVEWDVLVEWVCRTVIDGYRQGDPVIHLPDHTASEALRMRIDPYIQEKQHSLLFGAGGSGKSWLAMYMSILVCTGEANIDLHPEPGRVLYLDYETDSDTVWHRVNMITAGLQTPISIPEGFYYRNMTHTVIADAQEIQKMVLDLGIDFIVIDSAAGATGALLDDTLVNQYFNVIRELNVTALTIAHIAKTATDMTKAFGSTYWDARPRSCVRADSSNEPGVRSFAMQLTHTKSNNGQFIKNRAYELVFEDGSVNFKYASLLGVPEFAESLTLGQRITNALKRGGMTAREIAEDLDAKYDSVRITLDRFRGDIYEVVGQKGPAAVWGNLTRT
jgi:hypothetical protein